MHMGQNLIGPVFFYVACINFFIFYVTSLCIPAACFLAEKRKEKKNSWLQENTPEQAR